MGRTSIINILLTLLRIGLGGGFLVTGALKITDLGTTAEFMTRSALLPEWCSMPIVCLGVSMELVVGLCLVFRRCYEGATLWGTVMCSVFLFLYTQAWIRGLELSCNCTGSLHEIVNYPLDTAMRLLLLGAMLLLLWDTRRRRSHMWNPDDSPFDFSEI